MFLTALFVLAKTFKQPVWPLRGRANSVTDYYKIMNQSELLLQGYISYMAHKDRKVSSYCLIILMYAVLKLEDNE